MAISAATALTLLANASPASTAMQSYLTPIVATLCVLASLACVFFLVYGGLQYTSSSGQPEKLEHAKRIIKNALIGLALVLAAATLTAILSHAYAASNGTPAEKLPILAQIQPASTSNGLVDVLINAVVGLLRNVIQSVGAPFITALSYFTNSTPLMGDNSSVFNLWLAIVGITDVLFILFVILIGFHIMSFSTFGFDEIELKHLLPQLALIFLLINTSIFIVDGIIGLSNAMIYALQSGFESIDIWDTLGKITQQSASLGLAGLLVMIAFLVVSILLLIYYVGRLIALYVGAILAPLVLLIWLLPAFKDFAITAAKAYLTLVFVLFVHAVIILLAASIFSSMLQGDTNGQPNILMALILGLATVLALLKTQGVMQQFAYATTGPRAARAVAGSFIKGVSYLSATNRAISKWGDGDNRKSKSSSGSSNDKGKGKGGSYPGSSPNHQGPPLKTGQTRRAPSPAASYTSSSSESSNQASKQQKAIIAEGAEV